MFQISYKYQRLLIITLQIQIRRNHEGFKHSGRWKQAKKLRTILIIKKCIEYFLILCCSFVMVEINTKSMIRHGSLDTAINNKASPSSNDPEPEMTWYRSNTVQLSIIALQSKEARSCHEK